MKILLTTYGSLGDLNPFIALGLALKGRGHEAAIATIPNYRANVEAQGLDFHEIRPNPSVYGPLRYWAKSAMHPRTGEQFILRRMILPHLKDAYEDLKAVARGYDAVIDHSATYHAPIVCEELSIPRISVTLHTLTLYSAYNPAIYPSLPLGNLLQRRSPEFQRFLFAQMRRMARSDAGQVEALRATAGLKPSTLHPMFEGRHSPLLNLCLFSPYLAPPQRDWPANSRAVGFLYFDGAKAGEMQPELAQFLDEGPPPIVFTLGSTAAAAPGRFYVESAEAARRIGRRAVLIAGRSTNSKPQSPLPDGVRAFDYAPYSQLFPRAAAVVHQGGMGTVGLALRFGVPQIIVPFLNDQPDNADRIRRLGVGLAIPSAKYDAGRAARELERLLGDERCRTSVAKAAEAIRAEDGVGNACDAIEETLAASGQVHNTSMLK